MCNPPDSVIYVLSLLSHFSSPLRNTHLERCLQESLFIGKDVVKNGASCSLKATAFLLCCMFVLTLSLFCGSFAVQMFCYSPVYASDKI